MSAKTREDGVHDVIDQRFNTYRKGFLRGTGLIVVVLALAILGACSVTTIPTGHVGVLTLFGRVTGEQLPEGIHLINPMKAVSKFSVRTQEAKEVAEVPSSEGLLVHLESSLLYRLDPEQETQDCRNRSSAPVSCIDL